MQEAHIQEKNAVGTTGSRLAIAHQEPKAPTTIPMRLK